MNNNFEKLRLKQIWHEYDLGDHRLEWNLVNHRNSMFYETWGCKQFHFELVHISDENCWRLHIENINPERWHWIRFISMENAKNYAQKFYLERLAKTTESYNSYKKFQGKELLFEEINNEN